jgi:hypothetical protein
MLHLYWQVHVPAESDQLVVYRTTPEGATGGVNTGGRQALIKYAG